MTGPIGKEVHVDSLQELVKNVMKENAVGLLDDSFKSKLEKTYKHTLQKTQIYLEAKEENKVFKVFKDHRAKSANKVHRVFKVKR